MEISGDVLERERVEEEMDAGVVEAEADVTRAMAEAYDCAAGEEL